MTKEEMRILDLEGAIIGKWERNEGVIMFFHPIFPTRTGGKVDIINNQVFNTLAYELYIHDNNPWLRITDNENDQIKEYEIVLITTAKVLKLKNKEGQIFDFHP